jgi:hypothetical protein
VIVLWALMACSGGEPASVADCSRITDATAREDCRLAQARLLLTDRDAFAAATQALDDTAYDLLIVRLAFQETHHAGWLCATVRTEQGRTRCKRITGRPHLGGTGGTEGTAE